jgi:dTDP-glucose pyrophosphorylase
MKQQINVLIPMAGEGSRFADAGYSFPKPLICINNKPMIEWVISNFVIQDTSKYMLRFIFLYREEHEQEYNLCKTLSNILIQSPAKDVAASYVAVNELTEGAACTSLLGRDYINNNLPLVIANSDQYLKNNLPLDSIFEFNLSQADGGIITFTSNHPKWSFARTNRKSEDIIEVAEKNPISNHATAGIYFWKKGSDYVKYADQMIEKNIRTNGEFYICPVYNEAIEDKKVIKKIDIETDAFWGLGTPEDLNEFLINGPGRRGTV